MSQHSDLLYCYNKGCVKGKFDPHISGDSDCVYHPGEPVFHDASKKWSCCNKSSVDFTTFLQLPGCAKGPHNPVKPAAPPKPERSAEIYDQPVLIREPINCGSDAEPRPSDDEEMMPLNKQVDSRLLAELDKAAAAQRVAEAADSASARGGKAPGSADDLNGDSVEIGTACKNSGCRGLFRGPQSDREICFYHPGGPVFHEGMKYWSCCQRKTTEFDNFMAQEGCEQARHCWKKSPAESDGSGGPVTAHCRCDHHQGKAGFITLDVFAKLCVPEDCSVTANRVRCSVSLVFAAGRSRFSREFRLHNVIDPSQSYVNIRPTKVEIMLKKANLANWPSLELV